MDCKTQREPKRERDLSSELDLSSERRPKRERDLSSERGTFEGRKN